MIISDANILILDLEMAYDTVQRLKLWKTLQQLDINRHHDQRSYINGATEKKEKEEELMERGNEKSNGN